MKIIDVGSMVSQRTKEGFVEVRFDGAHAQVSPNEAREIAQHLCEAAAAAEMDAFLVKFGNDKLGEPNCGALLLNEFRKYRYSERKS